MFFCISLYHMPLREDVFVLLIYTLKCLCLHCLSSLSRKKEDNTPIPNCQSKHDCPWHLSRPPISHLDLLKHEPVGGATWDGAVDQLWIGCLQVLVSQTHLMELPWEVILYEHITHCCQLPPCTNRIQDQIDIFWGTICMSRIKLYYC